MVAWSFMWFIIVLVSAVMIISGAWIPSLLFIKWYAGFTAVCAFLTWVNWVGKS